MGQELWHEADAVHQWPRARCSLYRGTPHRMPWGRSCSGDWRSQTHETRRTKRVRLVTGAEGVLSRSPGFASHTLKDFRLGKMLAKHWAAAVLLVACAAAGATAQECYAIETDLKVGTAWAPRLWCAREHWPEENPTPSITDTHTFFLLRPYGPEYAPHCCSTTSQWACMV